MVPVVLPPLRERKSDIQLLVDFFVEKFNRTYGKEVRVSEDALEGFMSYHWPGNVRELANTLERLIIMCEGDTIGPDALPYGIRMKAGPAERAAPTLDADSLKSEVLSLERERIIKALEENGYVQSKAARALGITPRQLGYRIKKYRIETSG